MDIEIPAPRQTLNCVFQGGLTFERAYQGSVLVQGSLGESDVDHPPKTKATKEAPPSEPSNEEPAVEATSAHVSDDALKQEAKHAAAKADGAPGVATRQEEEEDDEEEEGRTLSDAALAELLASYTPPPPLHPQVGEARALVAERREPQVLHLRLDASAVRGKANIVGTLRSHADPSEVKPRVREMFGAGANWENFVKLEFWDPRAPTNPIHEEEEEEGNESVGSNSDSDNDSDDNGSAHDHSVEGGSHVARSADSSKGAHDKKAGSAPPRRLLASPAEVELGRWRPVADLEAMCAAEEKHLGLDQYLGIHSGRYRDHLFGPLMGATRRAVLLGCSLPPPSPHNHHHHHHHQLPSLHHPAPGNLKRGQSSRHSGGGSSSGSGGHSSSGFTGSSSSSHSGKVACTLRLRLLYRELPPDPPPPPKPIQPLRFVRQKHHDHDNDDQDAETAASSSSSSSTKAATVSPPKSSSSGGSLAAAAAFKLPRPVTEFGGGGGLTGLGSSKLRAAATLLLVGLGPSVSDHSQEEALEAKIEAKARQEASDALAEAQRLKSKAEKQHRQERQRAAKIAANELRKKRAAANLKQLRAEQEAAAEAARVEWEERGGAVPPSKKEAALKRRSVFRKELAEHHHRVREKLGARALAQAVIAGERAQAREIEEAEARRRWRKLNGDDDSDDEDDNEGGKGGKKGRGRGGGRKSTAKTKKAAKKKASSSSSSSSSSQDDDDDGDDGGTQHQELNIGGADSAKGAILTAAEDAEVQAAAAAAAAAAAREEEVARLKALENDPEAAAEALAALSSLGGSSTGRHAADSAWRTAHGSNRHTTMVAPAVGREPSRNAITLEELNEGFEQGMLSEVHVFEWPAILLPPAPPRLRTGKSKELQWALKPDAAVALLKKDLSKESYLLVTANEKSKRLAGRYRREWLLSGSQLIAWVNEEQERLSKASPELRTIAEANRGKYPTPVLALSGLLPGTHDTHQWAAAAEVDLDHGFHYSESILRVLHARRADQAAVPRRYAIVEHPPPPMPPQSSASR